VAVRERKGMREGRLPVVDNSSEAAETAPGLKKKIKKEFGGCSGSVGI